MYKGIMCDSHFWTDVHGRGTEEQIMDKIYPVKQIIDNLEFCVVSNWYVLICILSISSLVVIDVNVVLLSDR